MAYHLYFSLMPSISSNMKIIMLPDFHVQIDYPLCW